MTTSTIQVQPYTAAVHPLNVFSLEHMKQALSAVSAQGVTVAAGTDQPITIAACQLVGGGVMALALMGANTVVQREQRDLTDATATDITAMVVLEGSGYAATCGREMAFRAGDILFMRNQAASILRFSDTCRMLVLRIPYTRFGVELQGSFDDFVPLLGRHESPLRLAAWNYVHEVLPALGASSLDTVAHTEQAFVALLAAVYAEGRQVPQGQLE